MPKGQPIKCVITSSNPEISRAIRAQLKRHHLLLEEPRRGVMVARISARHQALLNIIRKDRGVTVREVSHFPENTPIKQKRRKRHLSE